MGIIYGRLGDDHPRIWHFNSFPLTPVVGAITKGAFEWSRRPPDELFADVRALGSLEYRTHSFK